MRRRRSRLPFIVLGGVALLLGATIGMAASNTQPAPDLLSWLTGASASPAATPVSVAVASGPAASLAPVAVSGPSSAAGGASDPAASAITAAPIVTTPTATAVADPDATPSPAPPTPGATARPTPAAAAGAQARAVYNGSRAKKLVALTFDDGYNPVALRQILAILAREKVTATFFPYGWAVHQDPAGWHMVVAAGYPIGNHTLTHATLTNLTPDQVTSEMVRGHRTIDLYSGGKSIDLMRPPGGAFNAPTARAIAKAGYDTIVLWDVDTFDWQGPSASTILARATKGTNGSIVLMHSGPLNTPKALPAIIANYRARGFTFVTVPQLLAAR